MKCALLLAAAVAALGAADADCISASASFLVRSFYPLEDPA